MADTFTNTAHIDLLDGSLVPFLPPGPPSMPPPHILIHWRASPVARWLMQMLDPLSRAAKWRLVLNRPSMTETFPLFIDLYFHSLVSHVLTSTLGKYNAAITLYGKALKLKPDPELHVYMARAHFELGQFVECKKSLHVALAMKPKYTLLHIESNLILSLSDLDIQYLLAVAMKEEAARIAADKNASSVRMSIALEDLRLAAPYVPLSSCISVQDHLHFELTSDRCQVMCEI